VRKVAVPEPPPEAEPEPFGQRLYHIGNGHYLQYNGKGAMPKELVQYVKQHDGEYPPFIPLPTAPTDFHLSELMLPRMKVRWKGKGKLPDKVLDYVCDNGTLPPHY
jgi:hypothetical protein